MSYKPVILLLALGISSSWVWAQTEERKAGGDEARDEALRQALLLGDSDRLSELGFRLGAKGLLPILRSEKSERVLLAAALAAAPQAEDAFVLLGALANLASDPDRSLAKRASEAAMLIANEVELPQLAHSEITRAQIQGSANHWLSVATQQARWADLRVAALEVGVVFDRIAPSARAEAHLIALRKDENPEIRAATVVLARHAMPRDDLISILEEDLDDTVALAAAQVLCGPLGVPSPFDTSGLPAEVVDRLIRLAKERALPIVARTDIAPCLQDNPDLLSTLLQLAPAERRPVIQKLRKQATAAKSASKKPSESSDQ